VLSYPFGGKKFDAVVSWLALCHIPDRKRLLEICRGVLKPGGRFYTDDLCSIGDIGSEQRHGLERDLYAMTLPGASTYRQDVIDAGFEIEVFEDLTADWSGFTRERLAIYRAERARHTRVHGEATVDDLESFYAAVDYHFQTGTLGGLRICAKAV
jgi:sarcosine/dimethylglycine N-methyltransferase